VGDGEKGKGRWGEGSTCYAFPMKRFLKEVLNVGLIVLAILSAGLGLKGFLLSSHFIDGGVTGISMLLSSVLGFPLAILILIINLPFIAIGLRQIGWKFALRSGFAIGGLSLCLAFVHYPDVTSDKVLTAVFGGFFIGAGIGWQFEAARSWMELRSQPCSLVRAAASSASAT